jgi:hypothetical protein
MRTLEIDNVLTTAYHAAAQLAAAEVNRHLHRFNLKRHPIGCHGGCLMVGERSFFEFTGANPLHATIREAGQFIDVLPMPVRRLVGTYL